MSEILSHNGPEMKNPIDAILFDMGGTLRQNHKREFADKSTIVQRIIDLLCLEISADELTKLLESREKSYETLRQFCS